MTQMNVNNGFFMYVSFNNSGTKIKVLVELCKFFWFFRAETLSLRRKKKSLTYLTFPIPRSFPENYDYYDLYVQNE